MLTLIRQKVTLAAQQFLQEQGDTLFVVNGPIATACLDDVTTILQNILAGKKPYRSTAAFVEAYQQFKQYKGDVDAKVGERIPEKRIGKRIEKKAREARVTAEWSTDAIMRKMIRPWIPWSILEKIVIEHEPRADYLKEIAQAYELDKYEKICVNVLEGKSDSIMYHLIGDSFRRALAEEWKKKYYAS